MLLQDIYNTVNYISNKHSSGNAFTINQFNDIIEILNRDFFKKKVEESGYFNLRPDYSTSKSLLTSKNLHKFIVNETLAGGAGTSYTYAYFLGARNNDTDVPIELVSEEEYHDRMGDSVLVPSANATVILERGEDLYVYPNTVVNVSLSYYRYPNDPFLDYYISTTGVMMFLRAGVAHVWVTGEYDSSGTAHNNGDPNWTSLTVELEYNEDMHDDFMNEILSRVGIRLKEAQIAQYAEALKAEQKQM